MFLIPKFHIDHNGLLSFIGEKQRPQPIDIFRGSRLVIRDFPKYLPHRPDMEKFAILMEESSQPLIALTNTEAHMAIFWRIELFDDKGEECDKHQFDYFWRHSLRSNLLFLSFQQVSPRHLTLRAEGRLIEILIYLIFFEVEESQRKQFSTLLLRQCIQNAASKHWNELESAVQIDVNTKNTLRAQLVEKFGTAAEAITSSFPRPKESNIFKRLFSKQTQNS